MVLDCTTVVPELAGSEFFGHERGSFTGAFATRDGAFALADGGTLFLDEVGELPLTLQAELLRVVQEGTYKRVGQQHLAAHQFPIGLRHQSGPSGRGGGGSFPAGFLLPHRRVDLQASAAPRAQGRHPAAGEARPRSGAAACRSGRVRRCGAESSWLQRSYPGNVRDLRRLVTQIARRHVGTGPITVGDVPEEERPLPGAEPPDWRGQPLQHVVREAVSLGAGLRDITSAAAEAAIQIAVGEEQGNLQRAARRLGVTDRALQLRRVNRRRRPGSPTPQDAS